MNPVIKTSRRRISAFLAIFMLASVLQFSSFANAPLASASAGDPGSVCFNNSSTASYINLNNSNNAVGTANFTLEMWVKVSSNPSTTSLVNGHSAVNGTSTLGLFLDGTPGGGNGSIGFSHPAANSPPGSVPASTWFHFAYVRTGTTGKVYINGVPRTSYSGAAVESVTDSNNYTSTNFRVGYPLTGTWPAGFMGCLAGVALTKSALYSADFSANLPYPSTRVMPADSIIFLKPTAGGFSNTGTGATPALTGSVTFNSDLPPAPITLASATVTGSAIYNEVLTAVPGTVSNAPSYTTSYQWRRAGTAITNATNSTYTLTSADIGSVISVTITVTSGGVSSAVTSAGTVSVAKIAQAITFTSTAPVSATYGSTYTPTATGGASGNPVTFTIDSTATSVCTISAGVVTVTGAGTCKVNADQASSANYSAAQAQQTFTVAKAAQATFTASQVTSSATWNGSAFTATPSFSTTGGSDTGAVTYGVTNGTATGCALSNATASAVLTATTAGTCTITATKAATTNYNAATSTLTFAFSQITTTSTLAISNSSVTYGSAVTLTASVLPSTATGTFSFSNNGTPISGCTSVAITSGIATCTTWKPGVGTYTPLTATYSGATNVAASTSSNSISLQITQATLTVTASSPTVIYGAAIPTITPSYSGFVNSETSAVVTGLSCSTVYTTTSAVGSLPATSCSGGSASNYSISYVSGAVTINKSTPTISLALPASATTATYGTAVTITATVSKPGTVTFKVGGVVISGCTSIAATTTATCSWTPIAVNATTSLTADFTPTDSTNYANLTAAGSLAINVGKASLSITASSHTVAFGSAIPEITPIYSGLVNGDLAAVVTGLTCTTTYTTSTSVGTTGSSCSGGSASNYTISYTAGVITIIQGGQTNSLTINSTSGTYGSTLSLTTLGGNGGGSNSFIVDSGPCTISGATLTPTAAGTCMVTATKAASGNYLAASSSSTAITVSPKGLTVSGLSGVNKEFDRSPIGTVTGTPTLVGVVGSDNVLLGGTPTFTFASANVANGITVTASGYTLTGTTASNYTLTQPTVTANITAKAVRVAATNTTVAFGAPVTSGVTASGLITPDAVGSASYTYTGTGTSTPPTAVGVYTVTPSNAVMSAGTIGNYTISYDTATLTILAKYTITFNANGGLVAGGSTSNVDFVVGDNALTLPTPTRANYTFTGWHTLQTNGIQVTGAYTPTATATLWAHWVQNSLYGMGASTKILTITTLAGVGNTYSANAAGGTIGIEYLADALPAGTIIDAYVLSDTSTATTLIGASNNYLMSLVLAWVALDGTVPTTATGKAISMTITNSAIKKGAKVYSVIGENITLVGTATIDGSAVISITDDPQIIIAITKPDAPIGVSATSGGNTVSTVTWTAPANDGGSVVTSYTAVSNAGQSCTTSTTSCQINGLTNGTSYTFTVTALNAIGVSDTSTASVAITPSAPAPVSVPVSVPASTPIVVISQAVISTPVPMIMPTLTSLTFVENAAKTGGKLVWVGTNIDSVLFTGTASTYPAPFNYGAFTLSWDGTLVNMVAGVTYTMKIKARSASGGSESKTIEYTIAKPVIDTSAADAVLKAAAEKKAADEAAAAALKIAQEKALAEAKAAADATALKVAQEKAAAEAKATAEAAALKIAQEKAAAEKKAAEDSAAALKVAQDKAAAVKAAEEAAALKIAQDKAAADAAALLIAKSTPVLNLFTSYATAKYTASQTAKMKKLTLKLEPATTLKCVGYVNTKGTTAAKAKATALAQAKTTCASAKKLNPGIKTVVTTAALTKAPKPLVGASNTKAKYRVDLFAYNG